MSKRAENQKRIETLRLLLTKKVYDNQSELIEAMRHEGYEMTQPTLSRDLRRLRVSKIYNSRGKYVYVLPGMSLTDRPATRRHRETVKQSFGFLSITYSGNIAVLKTLNGFANSLAAEIDSIDSAEILGSLAGDDTILLVLREDADREKVNMLLSEIIPHFGE